jgi:hypothetical protein
LFFSNPVDTSFLVISIFYDSPYFEYCPMEKASIGQGNKAILAFSNFQASEIGSWGTLQPTR